MGAAGSTEADMERPIFKPVGTPVAQLDTPALVVDLALVEQNLETLHGFFRHRETKGAAARDGAPLPSPGS